MADKKTEAGRDGVPAELRAAAPQKFFQSLPIWRCK